MITIGPVWDCQSVISALRLRVVGLRVLFLVTDLEIGGTPRVVRDLAIRLRSEDIFTSVACLAPWGPVAGELLDAGIRVTELGATSTLQLARVVRDFVRLTRQVDVVFSFLIHANTVAALSSAFRRDVRFFQSIQTTQPTPRWHWHLQGLIERAAEKIVVPSESVASVAEKWSHIPRNRFEVIPNAIDVQSFQNLQVHLFERPWTRIGFIGRLDPIKCVPDLVEALSRTERAELHIYGIGEDETRIRTSIHTFDVSHRAILHGETQSAHQALQQIDVLVLPSTAEGFGLVLIEAMAAGVPVVATDVPGIRDVVRDQETGLLVPPRSPKAISEAIQRLRNDVDLRNRLITSARQEVAQRYTWSVVRDRYRTLLLQ
ncbi:MAG: glycosyl transferase [Phycisphaerae bacterium]|nr:MAG: glycosyl transferase [Phycisphaerae bacterium]